MIPPNFQIPFPAITFSAPFFLDEEFREIFGIHDKYFRKIISPAKQKKLMKPFNTLK
jgi:hypothetical protein